MRAKLVDLEAEARQEGTGVRHVLVAQGDGGQRHSVVVPERYGTEWRCRDRGACDERYAELRLAVEGPEL